MSSVDFNIKEIADAISEMPNKYQGSVAHRMAHIKKCTHELEMELCHSLSPIETKDNAREMVLYIEQANALQTALQELRIHKAGDALLKDIEMKCYGLMLIYTRLFEQVTGIDMDETWWMEEVMRDISLSLYECKKEDRNDC